MKRNIVNDIMINLHGDRQCGDHIVSYLNVESLHCTPKTNIFCTNYT